MRLSFLISLISLGFLSSLGAQVKFEREYRLDREEIPKPALQFIEACPFENRIKWYGEESQEGKSVEAKTKHLGRKYSIEFDTSGQIQDVEAIVDWEELPKSLQEKIQACFDSSFEKVRIKKIQQQWTGQEENLLQVLQQKPTKSTYEIKYEIVIKARSEDGKNLYEMLFSDQGEVLRKDLIQPDNSDNLIY
ncbi:MAG: hypothetical protein GYB31_10535 [Bacteroidetes bacterium]|nr:hypothetical protein [Bacteroidota bacterium]